MTQCKHDGCGLAPMIGEDWCFFHHPDYGDQRHEASSRGGRAPRRVLAESDLSDLDLALLKDVDRLLTRALRSCAVGQVSTTVAKTCAYLARSITMVRQGALWDERLKKVQEKLDEMGVK